MTSRRTTSAMIIKYKIFYMLAYMLFLSTVIIAQTQQLKFNKITRSNGISLGKINAIMQDSYGFMWFSDQTNGCIVRYDGNHMTRFQNDPGDPNTLGGNYPECLVADSSGIIWIGFGGMGVDRFDPVTNTFTHFRHDPNDSESLSSDFVSAIQIDHLGNLWVGTKDGLDQLDRKTGKFYHYTHDPNDPKSLSHNVVRAIYEDQEGTLWVGTGFSWVLDNKGGLNRFDRSKGTFTRFMNDPDNSNSLVSNKVRSILEDSKGNFWIGTGNAGLHTLDRKTGKITRHLYDPKNPEKLSGPALNNIYDHITFITEDADENLWIGTQNSGISRYDPVSKKITHFGNNADNSGAFNDNSGWWAHATSDGLVWVSTQESNLYKIDLYNKSIPHVEINGGVHSFYEESQSALWIGTANGLVRKDIQTGSSQRFIHESLHTNSLSSNLIRSIMKDHQGIMWIGTSDGLNRYDPSSGIFTRYLHNPDDTASLSENNISAIYEDQGLNLWIGTDGGGLNLLNRKTGAFTHYQNDPSNPNSIINNWVTAILEDENDGFWIGFEFNGGILRMNRKTRSFIRYLQGHSITDIYMDSGGIIWVGTHDGFFHYDKTSDDFYSLGEEDAGIRQNSYVLSIIEDNEDNLWVNTFAGFYKLNSTRDHFVLFGKESGVIIKEDDRFFAGSAYKIRDGEVLIGNPYGYYAFYPMTFNPLPGESKLYFTSLWLNNRSLKPDTKGPLRESLYDAKEIQFNHDQNAFSFSFTAIDFRSSEDRIIYYTLENYDTDWRQTLPENKVNYVKVPPGNYIFRIKAVNSINGEWAEKSIDVIISPPWWITWWAFVLYGLLFIGGVYAIDRIQRRRLINKEREQAQEKELKQAREIEKAYKELKNTQSQLIQSEKMASLGELTAGIAHEIQNPLNFVNNFSEVSLDLIEELKGERDKIKGGIDKTTNNKDNKSYGEDHPGKEGTEQGMEVNKERSLEEEILVDIYQNLEKIHFHGNRASSIVKGMLQHSRIGDKEMVFTDINALADEFLRLAYHGLRAKDKSFMAEYKLEIDDYLPEVKVISQDIGRVLLNLINNAFYAVSSKASATEDSGYKPKVSVSTKTVKQDSGSDAVEIRVKDNGYGIPPSLKEKIFQPFFTTKPTGEGTGLGLSISYEIITKGHNGKMRVESNVESDENIKDNLESGTEFIITLPQ